MNTKHDIFRLMAKDIRYRSEFTRLCDEDIPEPRRTDDLCTFLHCSKFVAEELSNMSFIDLLNAIDRYANKPITRFANL